MKNIFYYKLSLLMVNILMFSSCSEDKLVSENINEKRYEVPEHNIAVLTDKFGNVQSSLRTFRNTGKTDLYVSANEFVSSDVTFEICYDESKAANKELEVDGKKYPVLPEDLVVVPSDIMLQKGEKKSSAISIQYSTESGLERNGIYAIPLKLKDADINEVSLSETNSSFVLLVKDLSKNPTPEKASGVKMISITYHDNSNPLNHTLYRLQDSKKPLFDMVVLFSASLVANDMTSRPELVFTSKSLDYEKYIKPLQDMGIEVVLSILPYWDGVGLANLSESGAKYLAQQLKDCVDTYNLDGVFFDEEYAGYNGRTGEDYVTPSAEAASRLVYEVKKMMPDKKMVIFHWDLLRRMVSVDGVPVKDFVDVVVNNYNDHWDHSADYGLSPKEMAVSSQEMALGYFPNESQLLNVKNNYGYNMIFALDPFAVDFYTKQLPQLQKTCRILFDEELEISGSFYPFEL